MTMSSMTLAPPRRQAKRGAIVMERKPASALAALAVAGLILAQLSTPGTYNTGIPATPGTRVPEDSPATRLPPPQSYGPSSLSTPSLATTPTVPNGNTGPAYSFGAAPPPVVSPSK
jgi:hypothetical protein